VRTLGKQLPDGDCPEQQDSTCRNDCANLSGTRRRHDVYEQHAGNEGEQTRARRNVNYIHACLLN
jgi:hypothetical protein